MGQEGHTHTLAHVAYFRPTGGLQAALLATSNEVGHVCMLYHETVLWLGRVVGVIEAVDGWGNEYLNVGAAC